MTEDTITRFDFSKAPPGVDECDPNDPRRLADAWAQYKTNHHPPGLSDLVRATIMLRGLSGLTQAEALAAVWRHYERCIVVARRVEERGHSCIWPRCLGFYGWPQLQSVERWLDGDAPMPECVAASEGLDG